MQRAAHFWTCIFLLHYRTPNFDRRFDFSDGRFINSDRRDFDFVEDTHFKKSYKLYWVWERLIVPRTVDLGSHHWSESVCCLWQPKPETARSVFTLRLKDVIDRKYSCLAEIYCPALEAPFRGLIAPTTCTDKRSNIRRSTVCSYGCDSGHNLVGGSQSLVCQLNGLWQGTVPYCKRRFFIAYELNN